MVDISNLIVNPEFEDTVSSVGVDVQACHIVAFAATINKMTKITDILDWVMTIDQEEFKEQLQNAIKVLCQPEDDNEYVLKMEYLVDQSTVVSHYNTFKTEFITRGWNYAGSPNAVGGTHKFTFSDDTAKIVNSIFDKVEKLYGLDYDVVFEILQEYYHTSDNQMFLKFTNFLIQNFEIEYATRVKG